MAFASISQIDVCHTRAIWSADGIIEDCVRTVHRVLGALEASQVGIGHKRGVVHYCRELSSVTYASHDVNFPHSEDFGSSGDQALFGHGFFAMCEGALFRCSHPRVV